MRIYYHSCFVGAIDEDIIRYPDNNVKLTFVCAELPTGALLTRDLQLHFLWPLLFCHKCSRPHFLYMQCV